MALDRYIPSDIRGGHLLLVLIDRYTFDVWFKNQNIGVNTIKKTLKSNGRYCVFGNCMKIGGGTRAANIFRGIFEGPEFSSMQW